MESIDFECVCKNDFKNFLLFLQNCDFINTFENKPYDDNQKEFITHHINLLNSYAKKLKEKSFDKDGNQIDHFYTADTGIFFHILHFFCKIHYDGIKFLSVEGCKLCESENNLKEYEFNISVIWQAIKSSADVVAAIFNSSFQVPLFIIKRVLANFYYAVNTKDGMYGFDLALIAQNGLDRSRNYEKKNYEFMGIVYQANEFNKNDFFANEIFFCTNILKISNIGFLHATGKKISQPEHWCGVFIDGVNKKYYFYNSLAKKNQINTEIFKCLNLIEPKRKYKFITNYSKQQGKNNLCGIYAHNFLESMKKLQTQDKEDFFNNHFNKEGNFDKVFENVVQHKYIVEPKNEFDTEDNKKTTLLINHLKKTSFL